MTASAQQDLLVVRCIPSSPSWMHSFYIGNLVRALQEEGIAFDLPTDQGGDFLSARWLRANTGRVHLLHLHWTHYHYTADTWLRSVSELGKFVGKLVLARRLGYRIIWTMHNYMPHERIYPVLHFVERFCMARLAHAVIVHCEYGRTLLGKKLMRRQGVHVIPLGNFGPYLPYQPPREAARRQFGFADNDIVFCYFGMIRPYKQVPLLIQEFQKLPGDNLRLMIVGVTPSEELRSSIVQLAAQDARIVHRLEYVSDAELAAYLAAADAAVLPYRDILGSGSAILALHSGLPVIAPLAGCLADLITPSCGLLYEPHEGALAATMQEFLCRDTRGMGAAARKRLEGFPWQRMTRDTAQVFHLVTQ